MQVTNVKHFQHIQPVFGSQHIGLAKAVEFINNKPVFFGRQTEQATPKTNLLDIHGLPTAFGAELGHFGSRIVKRLLGSEAPSGNNGLDFFA